MKTDALSRRLRFAPPNPSVKRLVLTEPDFVIFEAIQRHGPLPTHYLYAFTQHLRKDYSHLQNRLTEFYNGDQGGPYLIRPPQQFDGFEARYQHVVYDLAPRAKALLSERTPGWRRGVRNDPFLHQLMQACVGASLELAARERGLTYISTADILAHERCPQTTRDLPNPLAIPTPGRGDRKAIVPDDLFGLRYGDEGYRFFAVEIDRNTESIERRDPGQNSFGQKLTGYAEILSTRAFASHFGLPNLHVLTVTTNAVHAANIIDYIRRRIDNAQVAERFAFTTEPSFGANWRVPRTLLSHLIGEPWLTISEPRNIATP